MRKDPTEFRERFAKWKAGEKVYQNGLPKYGDGTTNVIPEDLQGLSDPQFQPQIDTAKVQMTPFVVDDTAYRAQKYHPGVTREQVQELYNNTPYIGSYNKGMLASPSIGAYFSNRDDYPFIRIGQNKPYEIDQMIAHESGHALEDLLFHGRTQQELDLLNKAYGGIPGTKYNEFGQLNRELRHLISKNNNNAIGKDLDNIITNMKDKDLLWLLKNNNLGYTKGTGQMPNLDASAIKRALLDVAQNKYTFDQGNGLMLAKNGKQAVLPLYSGGKSAKKGSYYLPGEKIRRESDVQYDNSSSDLKRRYDYKYVQAGKDNGWERVTDDETSDVFQDFVARPKSRGGNTTVGNWERQWAPKYEKPLEMISPEFDLISGVRGIIGMLPKKATTITTKNAAKITPKQWDESYMSAITNNDIKEVQRLRDLHFKIKAPKSKTVNADGMPTKQYHTVADGYPAEFNEFNPNIEGTHSAIYTSDSPIMSGTYSNKIISDAEREYYINAGIQNMKQQLKEGYVSGVYKKEVEAALESDASSRAYVLNKLPWLKLPTQAARQKALYANIENPLIIEGAGKHWNNIPISNLPKDVYKALKSSQMNGYTTRDIELAQKLTGNYDGAIIRNITDYGSSWKSTTSGMKPSTVYQINDPRNLKYADPITYDDAGKIIPLSQRDNFNVADLRYGIIPTLIGGSVYQTYK